VNIFFDVDETILGYDGSLRPLVTDIFQRLTEDGHRVYVWSGARTALGVGAVVAQYGLQAYVTDCFRKPLVNPRQAWLQTGIEVQPDFVIDDYPGIVEAFGGVLIKPYPLAAPADQDMQRVYEVIQRSFVVPPQASLRGE
jgi:phosphoglycolate phosphatase-like HAD superfamily hydrolase